MGIGIQCAEGVVLLTDSMVQLRKADGRRLPLLGRRKFGWIEAAGVAAVNSGYTNVLDVLCPQIQDSDFDLAAITLFSAMQEEERWALEAWPLEAKEQADTEGNPGGSPQLLAAGGLPGQRPRLAHLAPKWTDWPDEGEPAILPIGCWNQHFFEREGLLEATPPASLAACRGQALSWARQFLDEIYKGRDVWQVMADGFVPSVGWPLHVVTFDAQSRKQSEVVTA